MSDKKKSKKNAGEKIEEYTDSEEFGWKDLGGLFGGKSKDKKKPKRAKPTKPLGKHLSDTFREYKNKKKDKK